MNRNYVKQLLNLSIVAFFLSCANIFFMPLVSFNIEEEQALAYTFSALFWLCFIVGVVLFSRAVKARKSDKKWRDVRRFPIFYFFSNPFAILFDIIFILGVLILILTRFIWDFPPWLMTTSVFMTVFGFEMHAIFNGRSYLYTRSNKKSNNKKHK